MQLPTLRKCVYHPDREGLGICVRCRQVVCAECSTKIDRINYCSRCLELIEASQASPIRSARPWEKPVAVLLVSLCWVLLTGFLVGLGLLISVVQ